MVPVPIALFNYQNGGRPSDGSEDFKRLHCVFSDVEKPPGFRHAHTVPRVAPRIPALRSSTSRTGRQ
jgi:hypothetical protein